MRPRRNACAARRKQENGASVDYVHPAGTQEADMG